MKSSVYLNFRLLYFILFFSFYSTTLLADRLPLSKEKLQSEATHIVTGEISKIDIQKEQSNRGKDKGSIDYAIYCHLSPKTIEKGEKISLQQNLIVRCFIVKTKLSFTELIGLAGHKPIPEVGTKVRVYFTEKKSSFEVIYPNGFESLEKKAITEGKEIQKLRKNPLKFTFLLPLEALVLLIILFIICVGFFGRANPVRNNKFEKIFTTGILSICTLSIFFGIFQLKDVFESKASFYFGLGFACLFAFFNLWFYFSHNETEESA